MGGMEVSERSRSLGVRSLTWVAGSRQDHGGPRWVAGPRQDHGDHAGPRRGRAGLSSRNLGTEDSSVAGMLCALVSVSGPLSPKTGWWIFLLAEVHPLHCSQPRSSPVLLAQLTSSTVEEHLGPIQFVWLHLFSDLLVF